MGGEGAAQAELVGVVGVRAGALAEHHVPHLQLGEMAPALPTRMMLSTS